MIEVELHPLAVRERDDALRWYVERNPRAARAFLYALDAGLDAIAHNPEAWQTLPRPRSVHVRAYPLERFPYALPYVVAPSRAVVLAVAHAKRRPAYWARRAR